MNGAVIAVTPGGQKLARRVAKTTGFSIYLPEDLRSPGDGAISYTTLRQAVTDCFRQKEALVLIMACGIAVRILAPLIESKQTDPAVVVMDEAGSFAISLLSGHWGGANELAHSLGELLGATPVITTATDVNGLQAVDTLAREMGVQPEPFSLIKQFNAAMLKGEAVAVFSDYPGLRRISCAGLFFYPFSQFAQMAPQYKYRALLTNAAKVLGSHDGDLYLRPPNLCIGIGCRRGVPTERILQAIYDVLDKHNLARASIVRLCSIDAKKDELGLLGAAKQLGVPVDFYSKEEITALKVPYHVSSFVHQNMGVGAVCEPTAMLAAGNGRLLVTKQKMEGITVAVAEEEYPWSGWDQGEKKH
ncbi:cobalt-precorrin 5A hydrolase [Dethiobacter alkaliphilus]|uniref:cobalt-precorrin 5A hydrolase n=1 Tax=Dethiobacter alkaliphilus TaxID=427926 RepID=UPI0022265991|nr:cobalt-precorrin 5A hydrolase [Dethiobacter alkaliphilus]MCW3491480.1 cobalt-precorrin 5A hydrolase [Dethiobacter alkaliphilus]